MRGVLVILTTALSLECAQLSAASQCADSHPAVTVQIHDYAHVKSDSLSKAVEIVTRVYRSIGVGIEWLGVMQPDTSRTNSAPRQESQEGTRLPIAQLTINILTPSMASRAGIAKDVLGYVAVPPEGGMGRIGYVVYGKVREVAAGGPASAGEILGVIIAHDIGRLILGAGSGTGSGIMNRHWDRNELERVNPLALQFTPPEIARLRTTLEDNSTSSFAVATAGTGGSEPVSECIARRDDIGQ